MTLCALIAAISSLEGVTVTAAARKAASFFLLTLVTFTFTFTFTLTFRLDCGVTITTCCFDIPFRLLVLLFATVEVTETRGGGDEADVFFKYGFTTIPGVPPPFFFLITSSSFLAFVGILLCTELYYIVLYCVVWDNFIVYTSCMYVLCMVFGIQ